jgi:hypothetical protein
MSTTPSPDRRFIVALTAAVASATLAIGVTTGALLGWIGPRTTPAEPGSSAQAGAGSSPVVYVPITPTAPPSPPPIESSMASDPRLAMAEAGSHPDDRDDRHDHDEDDDD